MFKEEDEEDEDDSGEAEDIHYKDFFDPAEQALGTAALQKATGDTVTSQGPKRTERSGQTPSAPGKRCIHRLQLPNKRHSLQAPNQSPTGPCACEAGMATRGSWFLCR